MKLLCAGVLAVLCPLIAGCDRAPRVSRLGGDALVLRVDVDLVAQALRRTALDLAVAEPAPGGDEVQPSLEQSESRWQVPEEGELRRLQTSFIAREGGNVSVEVISRRGREALVFFRSTGPEPDATGTVRRHFLLHLDGLCGRWR